MTARTVLALVSLIACLAGCARVSGGARSGGNPWTRHGILRLANLQEPDTLDPLVGSEQIDSDLAELWAGRFFDWNDRNEFVPDLVTAVPTLRNGGISADGLTYTYHLRPNVLWQDGASFSAADVIFTWHAVMNPKNDVGTTVGWDLITAIDVRDPLTIAVHLKHPFSPFVATFFGPSGSPLPVLPEHLLARYPNLNEVPFNSRPVGTGPFMVEKWQRGSKIVFKANPHYWRGKPGLSEIWYVPVPDENTIVTELKAHDVDIDFNLSTAAYASAHGVAGYATELTPFTQFSHIALNTRRPLLSDVRVRRALRYATDVKRMIATITHGVNTPGYTDQPSFLWAYDRNVAHYDYDPAKARALLDEAGWKTGADGVRVKNGQRLSLTIAGVSGSATGNAVDVQVQSQWRAVGVEAVPKFYTTPLFFASYGAGGIVQGGKFDVAFFGWVNGVDPDDSTLFRCDRIPPRGNNVYGLCDRTLDAAEDVALRSSDRAVRKSAYDTVQRELADRVPAIFVWFNRRVSVVNTDLRNWRPAHAVSSFWNCYRWSI